MPAGIAVRGRSVPGSERILTPDALAFIERLERRFGPDRRELLARRAARQVRLDAGERPDFRADTASIRDSDWKVASAPGDLDDRRVEITGPAEPKMMINALNSGARVFMADLEDALSPTWANVVGGQAALADAVRGTLVFETSEKSYRLAERTATLLVRPRGWHLDEAHVEVDGSALSASLFDFGLYMFHNASERIARDSAPYFYLPKLQASEEARLWNDVFVFSQRELGIPQGSIRATVLIEHVLAAFEMDEILWELRDHAAGLNAGRWDYMFSLIKTFRRGSETLPDRSQLTMTVPFMRAYTNLLVRTCHRRGAHAIGGMAAFIPSRRDPLVNETAMTRVADDKRRESGDGFDGTWVAHPDLVPLATDLFDAVLGDRPNQKARRRDDVTVTADDLLDLRVQNGTITDAGLRLNVSVALQYLDSWLRGNGAAAINNLMEDAATAEIARSQLWQWRVHGARLDDGRAVDEALFRKIRDEELARLGGAATGRLGDAAKLLDALVLDEEMAEFLTVRAYPLLG